jgi:hypothetical protein
MGLGGIGRGIGLGLLDLLGGARDIKRQETEGFDWREKQAQARWQRERERELAKQADEELQRKREDAAADEMSDIISGSDNPDQIDLASLLPASIANERKRALIARAMGKGKERKSALQAQRLASQQAQQEARNQFAIEQLQRTQQGREALQAEKLESDQSGRAFSAEKAMERLQYATSNRPAGGGGRSGGGKMRPLVDPETGLVKGFYNERPDEAGGVQYVPAEGMPNLRTTALPAGIQESMAQAEGITNQADVVGKNLAEHPEWFGPEAALGYKARAAKIPLKSVFLAPPTQERAQNSAAIAGLRNRAIKDITGAQMSEKEVPRLIQELPELGDYPDVVAAKLAVYQKRLEIVRAVRQGHISKQQGIEMINSAGSAASPARRRRKFNPATGRVE